MSLKPRQRSASLRRALALCMVLAFAGFFALGTWQVKRLSWKLDLIERVNQRVHAAPLDAPRSAGWRNVSAELDSYRHVRVTGRFLYGSSSRVQALTELGSGFWLLTPFCRDDGSTVFINRGFVSAAADHSGVNVGAQADAVGCAPADMTGQGQGQGQGAKSASSLTTVTGLLRMSEPNGAFLRHNDALTDHWYSRDVSALALAHHLSDVAPYFIDADAAAENLPHLEPGSAAEQPIGGMTVISFPNNHLVYALTWFVLALMVALAFWWTARDERRLLHHESA